MSDRDEWEVPEGLPPAGCSVDVRGAWRPSDDGPPDVDRPDDYEPAARRSDAEWMAAARARPEALP